MSPRKRVPWWTPPRWFVPAAAGTALALVTVWAWPPRPTPEPHVVEGNQAYARRDFPHAMQSYEAAPGDGVPNVGVHMNRGLARFRVAVPPGDGGTLPELEPDAAAPEGYERAQDEMRSVMRGTAGAPMEDIDSTLRARAAYNLGNTYFSQHAWQSAIDQYKEALRLRPAWLEAAWNLEIARRRKDEDEHPDAGPDAGQDAGQDASQDASQDGGQPGDGGGQQGDGGNTQQDGGSPQGDAGGGANDGGNGQQDGGSPPGGDGGTPPQGDGGAAAPPPTSLAPLDQLERGEQDLQQMLMRRRASTMPRNPDDER